MSHESYSFLNMLVYCDIIIMVNPLVADDITVFITILFGELVSLIFVMF